MRRTRSLRVRARGDADAEVGALTLAGTRRQDGPSHGAGRQQPGHRRDACPARPPHRHGKDDADRHEGEAQADDDGPGGQGGNEHEARDEGARDGARRPDGRVATHHRPRLAQVAELQLHHRRAGRREHGRRQEEGGAREEQDAHRVGREPQRRCQRHDGDDGDGEAAAQDEDGPEKPPWVHLVRQPATQPRPGGDARQDRADDPGRRLERHPEVRREEPDGEDLEDEHGRRGEEDERPGGDRRHQAAQTLELQVTRGRLPGRSRHRGSARGIAGPVNHRTGSERSLATAYSATGTPSSAER